jgi:hypothetical protein
MKIRHTNNEVETSKRAGTTKLAIKRETLGVLNPAELRLAAGGFRSGGCYF